MTDVFAWTFQGGAIKSVPIPATAGNVVYSLTPPAGKRYLVILGRIVLVCDGNAANRTPQFGITDGTNLLLQLGSKTTAVTAGQTKSVGFSTRDNEGIQDWGAVENAECRIPANLFLDNGFDFDITVTAGLAGDSYSGFE